MKKRLLLFSTALCLLIGSAFVLGLVTRGQTKELNLMVEALADGEFSGQPCFNEIENATSQWVLYCGFCEMPIPGKPIPWSSTSTCK